MYSFIILLCWFSCLKIIFFLYIFRSGIRNSVQNWPTFHWRLSFKICREPRDMLRVVTASNHNFVCAWEVHLHGLRTRDVVMNRAVYMSKKYRGRNRWAVSENYVIFIEHHCSNNFKFDVKWSVFHYKVVVFCFFLAAAVPMPDQN